MDRPITISTKLSTVTAIGLAMAAVLSAAAYLLTTTVNSLNRQSDIIVTSLRSELASFKIELRKLDTDVVDVDEKVNEVDSTVAVADAESDQVKDDVIEVKEDVVGVKDEVVEVKEDVNEVKVDVVEVKEEVVEVISKVDEIGSNLDDAAEKLDVIKSALIVGFKDNDAVKLLLDDERLSMVLPPVIFSEEPLQGAAIDADSVVGGIVEKDQTPSKTIAQHCRSQEGPLIECYETFLKKAEQELLIGSVDE